MDPCTFIADDHDAIAVLLARVEAAGTTIGDHRREAFRQFRARLLAHASMEENVFYPALVHEDGAGSLLAEALEDHEALDRLLDELADDRTAGALWHVTFVALEELFD